MTEARESYSQHDEDVLVADHFGHREGGYFVEVGALDGVTLSNTCLLERKYGWTGLLVEANPEQAAACRANRPGSTVVAQAVTSPELVGAPVRLDVVTGDESLSSLAITPRVQALIDGRNAAAAEGLEVRSIEVPTATMDQVFRAAGVPSRFEFLSIDIEGHEWQALQGFSLGRDWHPEVVLLESATVFPEWRIVRYLFARGYGFQKRVGRWNHWYEPSTRPRAAKRIAALYVKVIPDALKAALRVTIVRLHLLDVATSVRARVRHRNE